MAVSEEECSTARSRPQASASNNTHYLAKCVLRGSAVLQVVHGRIRSPCSRDIVFGKETSIELVVIGNDGIVQSLCEQTIFGTVKDLDILPWNENFDAQNPKMIGRDLLIVLSDSGKLSFLAFCNEMNRFFPVTHIQLSNPGNSRNRLGRMLAVDSTNLRASLGKERYPKSVAHLLLPCCFLYRGCYIAASAYEDRLALFSVSVSAGSNIIDKKLFYPLETEGVASTGNVTPKTSICGTIWSMCFISSEVSNERDPVLAILLNRRNASLNELLLFGWNIRENELYLISPYVEAGPLALDIIEVPHLPGFAFLFRAGDLLFMDLRDTQNPCCVCRTAIDVLTPTVEELDFVEEPCSIDDVTLDDEGLFNDAAYALLKLRNHDPMCIDSESSSMKLNSRYMCSWTWEPQIHRTPRLIFCLDTGELFMVEISPESDYDVLGVHISNCLYKGLPCKALLWVEGGLLVAIVEMGDGMIMKFDCGKLICDSPIQNIAPILDMSLADFHNEKQDQMYVCCGVSPKGSLRTIRNGISVEKLLKTAPIYQGITGTWTMKMKLSDPYHSFLVLSFVEETRVLTVGLSFIDVTDSVGFQPDVCTLASGLVADGLLVQIHHNAVRLCQPNTVAHSEGIPSPSPFSTSWFPRDMSISMGAVGQNLVVVSTSNPCLLIILGIRFLLMHNYEIYELHHLKLHSEVSCISVPQNCLARRQSDSHVSMVNHHSASLPPGVQSRTTFVIGTHKPSVEVLSLIPDHGLKIIASGTISVTNTMGTATSGCIPQDVRLVVVDRLYVLSGLRNGMLLRFEWPTSSWMFPEDQSYLGPSTSSFSGKSAMRPDKRSSHSFGLRVPHVSSSEHIKDNSPISMQLIATRQIGITPVFLVPLSDLLDADVIALSDRPWLLQTARHSLSYTSISFQPSTHVTPVCSAECPSGVLFVAENSLHLVEMVHSKRLNVQKFQIEGTPRKVLYHRASRLLVVMRTELSNDTCLSDVCCVDPCTGAVLSSFKLEPEEIGKCMELVRIGNDDILVIGTSLSSGPAVMPSGEAESTKGRLVVLSLEQMQNIYYGSTAFFQRTGSSSQRASPSSEMVGCAMEHQSSSSACSFPDDTSEGNKLEASEVWQLRLAYSTVWPGMVLAICPYLERYFLASAGNAFYVCGFVNENPQKVKRYAVGRTRFMITSLQSHLTRIAVGDCRDGILFCSYHEDSRKLEQDYCDPSQRLVADCVLVDVDTAVVSDRKGSIAVLSCPDRTEDNNASPESNLTLSCAYYTGEIAMSIKKGSFLYKLPEDEALKVCDSPIVNVDLMQNIIIASALLGSIIVLVPISREEHEVLKAVEAKLAVHPLTAPVLGNDHNEFRSRENLGGAAKIVDGDMLGQFLELTSMQQEAVLSLPPSSPDTTTTLVKPPQSHPPPISVNQVVQLLERVHYALN